MINTRGIDGVPLAYLVRKDVVPPDADDNPEAYGEPTFADELVRHAKHEGNPSYQVDNQALWSVIRKLTMGGFAWSWVSSCARSQNGREAYLQLKTHYLGKSLQDKIQSDANKILENTFYDGKARNFTFEAYCTRLKQAFTDLAECGDELQESCKVRVFLKGLQAPELVAAKAMVIASNHLKTTVETANCYELCEDL
jgi:hypothetical protein